MEFFQDLGDRTGAIWAYFQNSDTGDLTVLGALILAALALATAVRCIRAFQPALGVNELTSVVGVGAAIASIFGAVGLFFLYVAATSGA